MLFKKSWQKLIQNTIRHGKKATAEKNFVRSLKEIQRFSKKQPITIVNLALLNTMPAFKMKKFKRKKRRNKSISEVPEFIRTNSARFSMASKFIIEAAEKSEKGYFYKKLASELLSTAKNQGLAIELKNEVQKKVTLKRNYLRYFRF